MQRFGIIGSPLRFTLSPYIHYAFATQHDKKIIYNTWNVEKKDVKLFVTAIQQGSLAGVSVTAPYKEVMYNAVANRTALAQRSRAVNTVYCEDGQVWGDNTDILGIQAVLHTLSLKKVTILGTGATARSAIVALQECGIQDITICGRNTSVLKKTAKEYDVQFISWNKRNTMKEVHCIINTIPIVSDVSLFTAEQLKTMCVQDAIVIDVHYKPVVSPLLAEALRNQYTTVNGLLLFVTQAQHQFQKFTGILPEIETVYTELKSLFLE